MGDLYFERSGFGVGLIRVDGIKISDDPGKVIDDLFRNGLRDLGGISDLKLVNRFPFNHQDESPI